MMACVVLEEQKFIHSLHHSVASWALPVVAWVV